MSITRASLPKPARTKDFFSENGESLRSSIFYLCILAKQHVGSLIPDQKSNPLPLHWMASPEGPEQVPAKRAGGEAQV